MGEEGASAAGGREGAAREARAPLCAQEAPPSWLTADPISPSSVTVFFNS